MVTSQYNNPAGLYSSENIKVFNSAVDDVKTMTAAPEAYSKWDAIENQNVQNSL